MIPILCKLFIMAIYGKAGIKQIIIAFPYTIYISPGILYKSDI